MTQDSLEDIINIIIEDLGHLSKNVARGYGAIQPTVRSSKPSLGDSEAQDAGEVKEMVPVMVSRAFLKAKAEDQINEVMKGSGSGRWGKSGFRSKKKKGWKGGSADMESKGQHPPFEMNTAIHPKSWDPTVAKMWDKLVSRTQKFIMAMPAAVASLGFAKDENDAKSIASKIIGGTWRSGAGQAAAVYGGPYLNDLQGRATGCKPGSYYFVRGDTCPAKPGGVYSKSGKYAKMFKKYEELTGFGKSETLPDNWKAIFKSKKAAAKAAGAAILGPNVKKGSGKGHGSGKAIDSALVTGQVAMIDKAAAIAKVKAHKLPEVDHIHITITEEREISNIIKRLIDEDQINEVLKGAGTGSWGKGGFRSKKKKGWKGGSGDSDFEGGGKCASVPDLCISKGDKKYLVHSKYGGSEPGFWKKFRQGLQQHVNNEYPELGLRIKDLGVTRDLKGSAFPSNPLRVAGSKHGAGLAADVYLHTKKYGKFKSIIKDNPGLAKDKKLIAAIRSYVATQPGIKWGGEFGDGPEAGAQSRGVKEFHHFEFKDDEIIKLFSKHRKSLEKIGVDYKGLTSTKALADLYKKLV